MSLEFKDILEHAMELPFDLRSLLTEMLLESLDVEEDFPIDDDWMIEIKDRCWEIDEGRVELIPGESEIAQIKERLK